MARKTAITLGNGKLVDLRPRSSGDGAGGKGLCYNCGEPGHIAKDCTARKKHGGRKATQPSARVAEQKEPEPEPDSSAGSPTPPSTTPAEARPQPDTPTAAELKLRAQLAEMTLENEWFKNAAQLASVNGQYPATLEARAASPTTSPTPTPIGPGATHSAALAANMRQWSAPKQETDDIWAAGQPGSGWAPGSR